jgi:hypothetical protein
MRVLLTALLSALCAGIAVSSQPNLLSRKESQLLHVEPAFLQEEVHAGSGTALVGAPTCDSTLSDPICFSNKRGALLPNAVPAGLVGHWSFDEDSPLDMSGNGNHAVTELVHGPSPGGSGHSAVFRKTFMMVPNSPQFTNKDFTYSFWIYLVDGDKPAGIGSSSSWCTLLRKGIHEPGTQQYADAPSLVFNHRTGQVRAKVTTSIANTESGEFVDSNARIMADRWMHIALVYHSSHASLLLYVNGILDNAMTTKGVIATNEYPLYIGGDPFATDECSFTVYIDELRAYSHAVPPHQLQAEAAPSLGGTDPSYVRLACLKCSLEEAAKKCPKNRHICTSLELHTGGYQVARSLGWLSPGTHVWTHAAVAKGAAARMNAQPMANADSLGLGLCCEGSA